MIEGILKDEEEHAADLTDLLYVVDPRTGETEGEDPGTRPMSMQECRPNEQAGRQQRQQRGADGQRQQPAAQQRGAELAPAHEPGTRGRPPRKGADEVYDEEADVRAGAESGASRSVHVTNPSRKRKKIA